MELRELEFYKTPFGEVMVNQGDGFHIYEMKDREFTCSFISVLSEMYPDALKSLNQMHADKKANIPFMEYRMVKTFIGCNFGNYDQIVDIDTLGNFNFEHVSCPLRGGDCKFEKSICKPKIKTDLSDREIEVMRLFSEGFDIDQVADKCFISATTAQTHRRNAFKRAGVHTLAEFIIWAKTNNLFL
jgi:DNA-binding CsgD family transcriptional regulator